ncbi:ABC transporter substrate-binding protein [Phototrophicus methaneseepsis]|uniref:Thiamine pyrimidine synthase n=1 Tax=Phototrophicus methaneseepsis TaxID=2710758 RepID=A0A7S8EBI1_9CHLR|nr:ABC transporter substrate-binding protein [Phototrophicus methaneseepsis]QPC83930.1 ABC transporter substrate-binding protein [Phototrophicus methaneseepsis]
MHTRSRLLFFVVVLALALAVVPTFSQEDAPEEPAELTPFTFMAGYIPQANLPFVGVYVAKEMGYFEEEGLDVMIEHATGGGHLQLVTTGEVQVTTQDAAVLLQRVADPGLPLVSLALIGQRGQQAFAALADSGMETPADWAGHIVGYKGTPPPDLFALLDVFDLTEDDIELVDVGYDPRILTEGRVDVYPLFRSNEPDTIASWGYDITLWDAADYGVPTLGLTYVTSQQTLAEQPEALTGFLRAALRGIEYATENPDEAIEITLTYAGPEADPDHQRFMLESELQDAQSDFTEAYGVGWQTLEQWQSLADMLATYDITVPEDVESVFTTDMLAAIYDVDVDALEAEATATEESE